MKNIRGMRLGIAVLYLVCACFLTGCSNSSGTSQTSSESTVHTEDSSDPNNTDHLPEESTTLSDPVRDVDTPSSNYDENTDALKIVDLKAFETYSCNDGEYFYTFDSIVPQFEFHNSAFTEQENKLNQYFKKRQDNSNDATSEPSEFTNYKKIDRSLIESLLSENPQYNTSTTQSYTVLQTEDRYCSILMDCYMYGGGAHGSGWIEGYFIDLFTGDVLSLPDLFDSTDDFRHYVANYFYKEYYAEYSGLSQWDKETLFELFDTEAGSNWYIKDNALFVEYGDYALGSYADGHQLLSIPLEYCSDYWNDRFMTFFDTIEPKGTVFTESELQEEEFPIYYGIVRTEMDALNVRNAPSKNAEKIGEIEKGMEVGVYSEKDGWCEIRYNGEVGYIAKEYVEMVSGEFAKPVIYLYPEKTTEVSVKLELANGKLTCSYPEYHNGWNVIAYPDGTIKNKADNDDYSYLYWESESEFQADFSTGFVVKGEDTAAFLKEKLSFMGLTPKEYNEFIVYWLPIMQNNPYNLVAFQMESYTDAAKLEIEPEPDSLLRIFMAFKALDHPADIPPQTLDTFERNGFTVVEWGGTEIK